MGLSLRDLRVDSSCWASTSTEIRALFRTRLKGGYPCAPSSSKGAAAGKEIDVGSFTRSQGPEKCDRGVLAVRPQGPGRPRRRRIGRAHRHRTPENAAGYADRWSLTMRIEWFHVDQKGTRIGFSFGLLHTCTVLQVVYLRTLVPTSI